MTAEAPARRAAAPLSPHRSLHEIPFANGLVSSKGNLRAHALDSFRERIYLRRDERTPTRSFTTSRP